MLQVLGISHLARDLRKYNEFLACGREGIPLELQFHPTALPSRRSTSPEHDTMMLALNRYDLDDHGMYFYISFVIKLMSNLTLFPAKGNLLAPVKSVK